jgi:hypothetical protein
MLSLRDGHKIQEQNRLFTISFVVIILMKKMGLTYGTAIKF